MTWFTLEGIGMHRGSIGIATAAGWIWVWMLLSNAAWSQTIDTAAAQATVGQPLRLTLRVRDFDAGPTLLDRACLQAEVRQGDMADTVPQPLRWRRAARTPEGDTLVALDGHSAVEEPLVRVKVALLCGAPFVREFTLLAEAPPARDWQPARPRRSGGQANRQTWPAGTRAKPPPAQTAQPPAPTVRTAALGAALTERPAFPTPNGQILAPASLAVSTLQAGQSTSASPLTDAFMNLWQHDIQRVREEQRLARATLASLNARLDRAERDTWQMGMGLAALGAGASAIVILWRMLVDVRLRRMGRSTPSNPRPSTGLPPAGIAGPGDALRSSASETTSVDGTARVDAPTHWPQSEFGQAAFDEGRHADLLTKVDAITASGYPGASIAVLENALQEQAGKSAGILLRLLDLYRSLRQPWNHERVGAELQAIYNVRIPAIDAPDEGRRLEAHVATWQYINRAWAEQDAPASIARLLVRPTRLELLDLAAFREALALHALCSAGGPMPEPAAAAGSGNGDSTNPPDLPALPWSAAQAAA